MSGIAYAGLCVTAVQILVGAGAGSGDPDKATGGVLSWPGGPLAGRHRRPCDLGRASTRAAAP